MACPTCDHTMGAIGFTDGSPGATRLALCPRCGTVRYGETDHCFVPKLVSRVRELVELTAVDAVRLPEDYDRLGIRESIMVDEGVV